jgi:hypothetical protein
MTMPQYDSAQAYDNDLLQQQIEKDVPDGASQSQAATVETKEEDNRELTQTSGESNTSTALSIPEFTDDGPSAGAPGLGPDQEENGVRKRLSREAAG